MKSTATAINEVFVKLKAGLGVPIFKYTNPTPKKVNEYIIINSLPISADIMQHCTVNVNYHVKDLSEGIPDVEKIEAGTNNVLFLIQEVVNMDSDEFDILIDFESQETLRDEPLKEHYSNMRFKVKIINKI
jgi:hypothetical protein